MNLTFTDVELSVLQIVDDEILSSTTSFGIEPELGIPKGVAFAYAFDFEDEFPMNSMQRGID